MVKNKKEQLSQTKIIYAVEGTLTTLLLVLSGCAPTNDQQSFASTVEAGRSLAGTSASSSTPGPAEREVVGTPQPEGASKDPNCETVYPREGYLAVAHRLGRRTYTDDKVGEAMARSMPMDVFNASGVIVLDDVTYNGSDPTVINNIPSGGKICWASPTPTSFRGPNKYAQVRSRFSMDRSMPAQTKNFRVFTRS